MGDATSIVCARRDEQEWKEGMNQRLEARPCKPSRERHAVLHVRNVGHTHRGRMLFENVLKRVHAHAFFYFYSKVLFPRNSVKIYSVSANLTSSQKPAPLVMSDTSWRTIPFSFKRRTAFWNGVSCIPIFSKMEGSHWPWM